MRFGFFRIHQSLVQKPLTIDKFWPMASEVVNEDTFVMTAEMYAKIKKAHGIN